MKNTLTNVSQASGLAEKNSKNRAGATLVEAMVALAIFAVFTTGACKLLSANRKILDMARDHYIAANLAKDRIELTRTFGFDQIPELAETDIRLDDRGTPSATGHFRRTTQITTVNSNLYQLAITVDIQDRKTLQFAPAQQTISTYVSKHL